jgi:hypothetical protein
LRYQEHCVRGDHHRADPLLLDGYEDLLELAFHCARSAPANAD